MSNSGSDNKNTVNSENCKKLAKYTSLILKPPTLVLKDSTLISENNSASSTEISSKKVENKKENMTSVSDIKEYLEMIPVFRGEPELLTLFIKESEKIIKYFYDVKEAENPLNDFITSRIRAKIQGEAALYIANKNCNNWEELRTSLISAYADKRDDATLAIQIAKLEQGNETPFEFYKKIQKLLNMQISYVNLNVRTNNIVLINHFQKIALKVLLNGLKDPLGSLMRTKDPQDLDTALNLLTNNYQKEVNCQKTNKPISNNQNKTHQLINPSFQKYSVPFGVNMNYPYTNRYNNNQHFRSQPVKRPADFSNRFNNQNPRQNSNNEVTPMSISTNNTYRPPNKKVPLPNFNYQESYDIEEIADLNISDSNETNDEIDDTPYNNFLEEKASEVSPEE